jgi:hypothetical protein
MLAGEAPGGFAVPRKIDGGQRFIHDLLLRRCPGLAEDQESPMARLYSLIRGVCQTSDYLQ